MKAQGFFRRLSGPWQLLFPVARSYILPGSKHIHFKHYP